MTRFTLEIYYDTDDDRGFAESAGAELLQLVRELAPHIDLEIHLLRAWSLRRNEFPHEGRLRDVPCHDPSAPGRQALLITNEDSSIRPEQGFGWAGACVVSKEGLIEKAADGGRPTDIVIHEWIHTLEGQEINGRLVPFADRATEFGFVSRTGPDGEETWHDWYRHALGG